MVIAGEGVGVGAFEIDEASAVLVKVRMLLGVVEAVLVVGDDLHGFRPGAEWRRRFGVPDLPEERAAVLLHGDQDEPLAVLVPIDRASVGKDVLASRRIAKLQ